MALSVVNHVAASADSAASVTTSGLSVSAGNLLVAIITTYSSGNTFDDPTTPLTDSAGNTWVKVDPAGTPALFFQRYQRFRYVKNCLGGGSVTFTYTVVAGDYPQIAVMQIAGADTTAPLDHHTMTETSAFVGTGKSTSAITTTVADEILAIYSGGNSVAGDTSTFSDGGGANSIGTPTKIEDTGATEANGIGCALGYVIVSATGTYAAKLTLSADGLANVGIASFKAASGGAPPPYVAPFVAASTYRITGGW
jgi:hypothetical protein